MEVASSSRNRRRSSSHQRGEHPSEQPPGLTDDLERPVIAQRSRLADVPRVELTLLVQHRREYRRTPLPRAALGPGDDGRGGRHGLKTSPVAAGAIRAVGVRADVPYVAGATLDPAVEPPVRDDPAPDPGPHLDEEQIVHAPGHPAPVLPERHHVHVVVHENGGGILPGEGLAYREAVPARHDRGAPQQPRCLLHRPRDPHPYGAHVVLARALLPEKPRQQSFDPTEDRLGTLPDVRRLPPVFNELAAQRGKRNVYGGGAKIHRGYEASGTGDAQEGRPTTTLRLGETVLDEQAGLEQAPHLQRGLAPADAQGFC